MIAEKVYVDTSAFYALLDRSDPYHEQAKHLWPALLKDNIILMTSNCVVIETVTLLQYRLGFQAAIVWTKDVMGVVEIDWADQTIHRKAQELWINLGRHRFSMVDCISHITMRQHQIEKAFCFKSSYSGQGFTLLPSPLPPHNQNTIPDSNRPSFSCDIGVKQSNDPF